LQLLEPEPPTPPRSVLCAYIFGVVSYLIRAVAVRLWGFWGLLGGFQFGNALDQPRDNPAKLRVRSLFRLKLTL
jgi:hypothetical protein